MLSFQRSVIPMFALAAPASIFLCCSCSLLGGRVNAAQIARGQILFETHCLGCHGGRIQTLARKPPSLVGLFQDKYLPSGTAATDNQVQATIDDGRWTHPAVPTSSLYYERLSGSANPDDNRVQWWSSVSHPPAGISKRNSSSFHGHWPLTFASSHDGFRAECARDRENPCGPEELHAQDQTCQSSQLRGRPFRALAFSGTAKATPSSAPEPPNSAGSAGHCIEKGPRLCYPGTRKSQWKLQIKGLRLAVGRNSGKIVGNRRVVKHTLAGGNAKMEMVLYAGFQTRPAVEDIPW
jgi:hypothetical protein